MRANAQLVQKVAAAQVPDLKHHMMGPGGNLSLPREGRSQSLKINSENNFIRRGTEIIKLKVLQKKKRSEIVHHSLKKGQPTDCSCYIHVLIREVGNFE